MNHACFLPKKVLNMKLKGKCPRGKWDQDENQRLGNMSHKRMLKGKLCEKQI